MEWTTMVVFVSIVWAIGLITINFLEHYGKVCKRCKKEIEEKR